LARGRVAAHPAVPSGDAGRTLIHAAPVARIEQTIRTAIAGGHVTKADIVDVIASATGLTKVETEAVVDGFIQTVINAMKEGKNIEIRGFGSFKVKKRKGRIARNPRTGQQVMVDEHYVPIFKVSKELKHVVDENLKKAGG
jgi:DNA-binding protein HU-beta